MNKKNICMIILGIVALGCLIGAIILSEKSSSHSQSLTDLVNNDFKPDSSITLTSNSAEEKNTEDTVSNNLIDDKDIVYGCIDFLYSHIDTMPNSVVSPTDIVNQIKEDSSTDLTFCGNISDNNKYFKPNFNDIYYFYSDQPPKVFVAMASDIDFLKFPNSYIFRCSCSEHKDLIIVLPTEDTKIGVEDIKELISKDNLWNNPTFDKGTVLCTIPYLHLIQKYDFSIQDIIPTSTLNKNINQNIDFKSFDGINDNSYRLKTDKDLEDIDMYVYCERPYWFYVQDRETKSIDYIGIITEKSDFYIP